MKDFFDVMDDIDSFGDRIDDFWENCEKQRERAERISDAIDTASQILPDIGYMALDAAGELMANLFDH